MSIFIFSNQEKFDKAKEVNGCDFVRTAELIAVKKEDSSYEIIKDRYNGPGIANDILHLFDIIENVLSKDSVSISSC